MRIQVSNYRLSINDLRLRWIVFFCLFSLTVFSQQDKMLTIVVKEGQHIRDLAEEYLNDANLWAEILRVNNLNSVTEVKPGMELKIPSNIVSLAGGELNTSLEKIQEATKAGARLFAPGIISNAIRLREEAVEKRKASDWEGCIELAKYAKIEAQKALKESIAKNDVSAEAVLNDRRGNVQSRKQIDLIWNNAPLYATLIEQQKIRTLSQSLAEILFRDESRLRLNENSQAIVQKMRVDLLKNKQVATVSLIEGDIYALLAGSPRKEFNVNVPGVDTKINSTNFWINRDKDATRFANYQGEIEVSSGGSTIVLGENQGSQVRLGMRPTAPEALLLSPSPLFPEHNSTVYQTSEKKEVILSWEPVEGAVSYWVEIALDKSTFKKVVLSQMNIKDTRLVNKQFGNGVFYWNVAAVDENGYPGVKSEARLVKIITDDRPPFLLLHSPKQGEILLENSIHIVGETEGDAVLAFAGRPVRISSDGKFTFEVPLTVGLNNISFEATDPAGNMNTLVRSVKFMPYKKIEISQDGSMNQVAPNQFVSRSAGFTYRGRTEPAAFVVVQAISDIFMANTFSDDDQGIFALSVPLLREKNDFDLSITTLAKHVKKEQFTVAVDLTPPEIRLDREPVPVSKFKELRLKGIVIDGINLNICGSDIELLDGRFDETIELKPGKNNIQIIATDLVGNATYFERDVVFDKEPPKLLKYNLSPKIASGGESVSIVVFAEDEFGMKRAAKFTLQAGEFIYSDYLRFYRDMQCYRQMVNLPMLAKGEIKVTVELEDYHGNKREFRLN